MHAQDLTDGWTLAAVAGPVPAALVGRAVPARVPGTSHTALLDAGLIPDPYLDRNEEALAWMHRTDWTYERLLDEAPPARDERVDLVFDGIDTVATVSLGGRVVGRTANQHRCYRFDVRALVGDVPQLLRVDIASALAHAEAEADRLGARPTAYARPFNMVRKMACSFGWDWGPNLQTAGLWRPVRVERWRVARLLRVRPLVTIDPRGTAHVAVHVDLERSGLPGGDAPVSVVASVAGVRAEVATTAASLTLELAVEHAPLWWPVGHGGQPLHELVVTLAIADPAADVPPLDVWSHRIGFRTVGLDTSPDEHGTAFRLLVNGRPIFVKGVNWVPDDHLLTRVTRERLAHRLDQALGAHANLVRVWGGGVYESRDFYELADERGLLVWQDFLLACAAYPEEQPIWDEIEAEARGNVARLSPHPSLVLWNGGNENLWGHEDWGWRDELGDRTWGLRYATELLRDVVADVDPTRPYTDNSPYSPTPTAGPTRHPNDPDHGTHHEWEVWNRVDYTAYRDDVPRFCSEFGFQAPPTWATLARAVRPEGGAPLAKDDPTFLHHQKAEDGNDKLDRGVAPHLGVPTAFGDWHWATQLNQARAVRLAVEHYRSWWPRTAGAIVWQLNDCWPVTSWSAIDGDGRRKPLWYALRAAFTPRLLTIRRHGLRLRLAVVNDTPTIWRGAVRLERLRLDGEVLAADDLELTVGAWSVGVFAIPDVLCRPDDATREVLAASLGDVRTWHTWAEDVDLALDPDPLEVQAAKETDGYRVEVTARSFARDVTILPDRLDPDASTDDALVTLRPGDRATFHVRTRAQLDPALLGRAPVLRSANDVVVPRLDGGRPGARRPGP